MKKIILLFIFFCVAASIAQNDRYFVPYGTKEDYKRAIAIYTRAIQLNPEDAEMYNNRGLVYHAQNDYNKAIADLTKAIQLNPNFAVAYYNRGNVYHSKNDNDKSIADFNSAIRIAPNFAEAYSNRGTAYNAKKNYDKAIENYTKAIQLNPSLSEAYSGRGLVYILKLDFEKAIADIETAMQINPNDPTARKSFEIIEKIRQENDNKQRAVTYSEKGTEYFVKKDYDNAIASYSEAIRLTQDNAIYYILRGIVYATKKDYDTAILDYNEAIRQNPNNEEAYFARGDAYLDKSDAGRAIVDYSKSIQLKPGFVDAYYKRGNAYLAKKDFDRAITDYNKTIQLNPNKAKAFANRGIAFQAKGNYGRAIIDFNNAIQLDPNEDIAYLGRGVAYAIKEDYYNAVADFESALKINPNNHAAREALKKAKGELSSTSVGNRDISKSQAIAFTPSLSKLQNGWEKITIENIGSFDIPPTMELQSSEYRRRKEELSIEDTSPFQIIVQQKGLNDFTIEGASKYARIMFKTEQGSRDTELTLDFDIKQFDAADIMELNNIFVAQITSESVGFDAKILEWYPIKIEKINGMSCIHTSYKRQLNNNIPVIVHDYHFFNYYYDHTLMLSYRESEKHLWEKDFITILKSLRIKNKYKEL